ncbi:hypothetical protein RhiirA1_480651 [Rhizophagus irregularis]|uniref:Uncharacterized protein n=1 Tax=Rhizophagus irregularis TaxID=588596 RepID=A0A2N0QP06_9GLOM|nr:hypothetical protein RhiirA1_480651 [Rhizophagus irregularis]
MKKKFYSRRYRKTTELIPPVAEDHQSNARRAYTYRNVTTTSYSRRGGFFNAKAHVRWTSSNFLHSGAWTTHRDNFWFNDIDLFSFYIYNNLLDTRQSDVTAFCG